MAYRVPLYPVPLFIWRNGNGPPAAPDITAMCQLTPGRRSIAPYVQRPAGAVVDARMHVLLPIGTDIRDAKAPAGPDLAECPAGSGRFYNVGFVDDIGLGFLNEHRFAMLEGFPNWPVPFPSGVGLGPLSITQFATGGSLGVAVNLVTAVVVAPANGVALIDIAFYPVNAGPVVKWNGATCTNTGASPALLPAPFAFRVVKFRCPVTAGAATLTIQMLGGAVTPIQFSCRLVTGTYGVPDRSAGAIGVAVPPACPGATPQGNANEIFEAAYLIINSGGAFGSSLGWTTCPTIVTDVIGGQPCSLVCADLIVSAVGSYPTGLPLVTNAGWTTVQFSYF